jgi:hypothetical protein
MLFAPLHVKNVPAGAVSELERSVLLWRSLSKLASLSFILYEEKHASVTNQGTEFVSTGKK